MNEVFLIETVEQLKIISEPTRISILDVLRGVKELTVKRMAEHLDLEPQKLYHHIRELMKISLVEVSRTAVKGHWLEKYYRITAIKLLIDPKLNRVLNELPSGGVQMFDTHLLSFAEYINSSVIGYIKHRSALVEKYEQEERGNIRVSAVSMQMHCTDQELTKLKKDIFGLIGKYKDKREGTKFYKNFSLILPAIEIEDSEDVQNRETEFAYVNGECN